MTSLSDVTGVHAQLFFLVRSITPDDCIVSCIFFVGGSQHNYDADEITYATFVKKRIGSVSYKRF